RNSPTSSSTTTPSTRRSSRTRTFGSSSKSLTLQRALRGGHQQFDNARMHVERKTVDRWLAFAGIPVDQSRGRRGFDQPPLERRRVQQLRLAAQDRQRSLDRVATPIRNAGRQQDVGCELGTQNFPVRHVLVHG